MPAFAGRTLSGANPWRQIGVVLGLTGAFAGTRLLTTMLFEVKPSDPLVYADKAGCIGQSAESQADRKERAEFVPSASR